MTGLLNHLHCQEIYFQEPRYEYEFPLPYIKPWNRFFPFELAEGFNEILDKHRDPKDIEKEVLVVSINLYSTNCLVWMGFLLLN